MNLQRWKFCRRQSKDKDEFENKASYISRTSSRKDIFLTMDLKQKSSSSTNVKKVVNAVEAFGPVEVLASALEELNPTDHAGNIIHGADWQFDEFSLDSAISTAIYEVCKSLGMESSSSSLIQNTVTVISYAAIAEIVEHAFGIGGLAKIDFNGKYYHYLEQITVLFILTY